MKPMKNLKNVDKSNECKTPPGTVKYILKYIPKNVRTIWCPCDKADSNIVKELKQFGYDVIHTHIDDGWDFLNYSPIPGTYDMIITNPPFNIKTKIFARAYELKVPFIFYFPITALEGINRGKLFAEHGVNVAVLMARINFITEKGETTNCWFNTSLFYWTEDGDRRPLEWIDNSNDTEQLEFKYD